MDNTKKNKFNIVDTFVVLILLAIIFGIIFITLNQAAKYTQKEKDVNYIICISGLKEEYISNFNENDEVLNSATLNNIGKITNVAQKPAKENGDKALAGEAEGEYVLEQTELPGVFDVYITITAKAKIDGRGVAYIGSERITAGSELDIRCGNFAATGHITEFKTGTTK